MNARLSSLLAVSLAIFLSLPAGAAAPTLLGLEPADVIEVLPLAMEALAISRRAAENNVRAAIMYLSRKGFGQSARPAKDRPSGFFDGWPDALRRYNGRRDRTETDRYYSDEYAEKIVRRVSDPDLFVPIEIKLAK